MTYLLILVAFAVVAPASAAPVEAPITAVTVYSDRARVTRTAVVDLSGRQRVQLPLLGERVDQRSIRLESDNARVDTVDLVWLPGDEAFPEGEARQVLAALEDVDSETGRVRRDRQVHASFDLLGQLKPIVPGVDAPRPAPRLGPASWGAVMAFARGWSERSQEKVRRADDRLRELETQRADLVDKARRIGAEHRSGGWRVLATIAGAGRASLRLTYETPGARWYPSYDVQLDPATQKVQVAFAALVSQETGEDWTEAALTVSTALPAAVTAFPKVYTWKIGERERFIPRPRPYAPPAPPPPPAPPAVERTGEAVTLRAMLLARTSAGTPEEGVLAIAGKREVADLDVASVSPPPRPVRQLGRRASAPEAPATAPAAAYDEQSEGGAEEFLKAKAAPARLGPVLSVGIAPPPGYRPPLLGPDLPASLAGGYDLTYKAAARETVGSGKGSRRVALFSRAFPVRVERRLFPDLAAEAAFLVAEIENPTGAPLPGGEARLFVGADPAGVARLPTVGVRETFTLPLGLDRAVKPVRNVKVVTTESGLISKDETTTYTVTIELANPTRARLAVRVVDQIPVTDDKDLEVKLVRTAPAVSAHDQATGKLEWRLDVPASAKATVSFVYTLKRPKGYRLRQ